MLYSVKVDVSEVKNRMLECRVRDHVVRVDQPEAFGADDTAPTPPEMLAIALGSCVVSTIQFLAARQNADVRDVRVTVSGDIDYSRAMGISDSQRAGFQGFNIAVGFQSSMPATGKAEFLKKVMQIGAAIDSIQNPTPLSYELQE